MAATTTATTTTGLAILKNLGYIPAFLLGLSLHSYGILAVFMVIDVLTGVIRSGYLHGSQSIKSHVASAGITAKMLTLFIPLIVVYAGDGAGIDLQMLGRGVLGMLILAEAYSILGNIHSINIKKDVPEVDIFNQIIMRLRQILEQIFEKQSPKP